jgi:hypothetical protein
MYKGLYLYIYLYIHMLYVYKYNIYIYIIGFESFSKFAVDGSNIDPYVLYIYDAVYDIAIATDKLFQFQTNENVEFNMTAEYILEFITASTVFPSLTTGMYMYIYIYIYI